MGLPVAKIGDIGVGDDTCHKDTRNNVTGVLVTGAGSVLTNGAPTGHLTSLVVRGDGHSGIVITGSGTVFAEGLPTARITDRFVGCFSGQLITGSGNVNAG